MSRTTSQPIQQRRPVGTRILAMAVVAFSLVAQLSGFVHFLLVEHVVCPEHGELVHVDQLGAHPRSGKAHPGEPGLHADHGTEDDGHPTLRSVSAEDGHEHDHCAVRSERRETFALPPADLSSVVGIAAAPLIGALVARSEPAQSIPLLFLAPKNSPPAVLS